MHFPLDYEVEGNTWKASGTGWCSNPGKLNKWSNRRSWARLWVGLTRGIDNAFGSKGEPVTMREVIDAVSAIRTYQLKHGHPGGANFIAQQGFFTDWEGDRYHGLEKSVQVVVFPEGNYPEWFEDDFGFNMRVLCGALAVILSQESVILDLEVDGQVDFIGDYRPEAKTPAGVDLVVIEVEKITAMWEAGKLPVPKAKE